MNKLMTVSLCAIGLCLAGSPYAFAEKTCDSFPPHSKISCKPDLKVVIREKAYTKDELNNQIKKLPSYKSVHELNGAEVKKLKKSKMGSFKMKDASGKTYRPIARYKSNGTEHLYAIPVTSILGSSNTPSSAVTIGTNDFMNSQFDP